MPLKTKNVYTRMFSRQCQNVYFTFQITVKVEKKILCTLFLLTKTIPVIIIFNLNKTIQLRYIYYLRLNM